MKFLIQVVSVAAVAVLLSACSGEVIPRSATSPAAAHTVALEMHKQEVRRYDCNGFLTSNNVEVVKAPVELMEIHPQRPSWTYGTIASSSFSNPQTASSPNLIYDKVKFTIDHGEGYFNMRVDSGINEIRYMFRFTDGSLETGSRFINVNYFERLLGGFTEVRPSLEDCASGRSR